MGVEGHSYWIIEFQLFLTNHPKNWPITLELMDFDQQKAKVLAALNDAAPDKSPKGFIDAHVLPISTFLNNLANYVTTSSCSGRISIFRGEQNKGGAWIFVTHDHADVSDVIHTLFHPPVYDVTSTTDELANDPQFIQFKFEPFILHTQTRDLPSAQLLLKVALESGYRNSGISLSDKRCMVAIRNNSILDLPIARCTARGWEMLVGEEYVKLLIQLSNQKLTANWERMGRLLTALESILKGEGSEVEMCISESKEIRWERKRAEGLIRQQQQQAMR